MTSSASKTARRDAIHRQFARFVAIGLGSTLLDAIAYQLALPMVATSPAKAAGYIVGTSFSIACNYRWTFAYDGADRVGIVLRCIILYATALAINVAANGAAIAVLDLGRLTLPVAFCFAVGVTTVYNFAGMRFWIFARRPGQAGLPMRG